MDERGDGRGALHRVRQPHETGNLRGLARGAHEQQERDDRHGAERRLGAEPRDASRHLLEVERPEANEEREQHAEDAVSVGIFADGAYGAGWNGVGPATYLGRAGLGVTGLIHGDTSQFIMQLVGATICAVYAFGFTFIVFKIIDAVFPLRVSKEVELEGLDVPEFGMLAYPEAGDETSFA